jgi:hypothetical protein
MYHSEKHYPVSNLFFTACYGLPPLVRGATKQNQGYMEGLIDFLL